MSRLLKLSMFLFIGLAVAACSEEVQKVEKLGIEDMVVGSGAEATAGSTISVHYTGTLMDGTVFDSSVDRSPITFPLGEGRVIQGWDEGVAGMKVGGKRVLMIPSAMAYGERGAGGVIPPNADLKFEVELMDVAVPKFTGISTAELESMMAEGVPVVDIRLEAEWQESGVIEGAKLFTAIAGDGQIVEGSPQQIGAFANADGKVIIICRSGRRSAFFANLLGETLPDLQVYDAEGGMLAWLDANKPVVPPK